VFVEESFEVLCKKFCGKNFGVKGVIMVKVRNKEKVFFRKFCERNLCQFGQKMQNCKTFFRKHFLPLKYDKM